MGSTTNQQTEVATLVLLGRKSTVPKMVASAQAVLVSPSGPMGPHVRFAVAHLILVPVIAAHPIAFRVIIPAAPNARQLLA